MSSAFMDGIIVDTDFEKQLAACKLESLYYAARFELQNKNLLFENNVNTEKVNKRIMKIASNECKNLTKNAENVFKVPVSYLTQKLSPVLNEPHKFQDLFAFSYVCKKFKSAELYTGVASTIDMYTPVRTRGKGKEKEGLCSLCKEPSWFKIKISQYWYHLNFIHGISSATGYIFLI